MCDVILSFIIIFFETDVLKESFKMVQPEINNPFFKPEKLDHGKQFFLDYCSSTIMSAFVIKKLIYLNHFN